uniref:ATP synthase F0 subunit 8 n=1 Tax=Laomedia healyi TaxID=576627 RepID=A0A4Y5QJF9_9EUCA|nr:ATP synthase F0 subunit 8 [Laomedia healyi]QCX31755.1 ATP synthase F0 subunit 8 [Laomedia healyi]
MPQMGPLLWLNLFFMFLLAFGLFIILTFYLKAPIKIEKPQFDYSIGQKNWKW